EPGGSVNRQNGWGVARPAIEIAPNGAGKSGPRRSSTCVDDACEPRLVSGTNRRPKFSNALPLGVYTALVVARPAGKGGACRPQTLSRPRRERPAIDPKGTLRRIAPNGAGKSSPRRLSTPSATLQEREQPAWTMPVSPACW